MVGHQTLELLILAPISTVGLARAVETITLRSRIFLGHGEEDLELLFFVESGTSENGL
jgi:hypothetical protein